MLCTNKMVRSLMSNVLKPDGIIIIHMILPCFASDMLGTVWLNLTSSSWSNHMSAVRRWQRWVDPTSGHIWLHCKSTGQVKWWDSGMRQWERYMDPQSQQVWLLNKNTGHVK